MAEMKKSITPMEHYNMSDFLRGQASKIMTTISTDDKVVIISNDRYERLLRAGIDLNEF